jgi:tetratricopeptide (TPR) repeat protein
LKNRKNYILFVHLLLFVFWLLPVSGAEVEEPVSAKVLLKRQNNLWDQATSFYLQGDEAQAALYFKHYWKTYPETDRAEEALWRAAGLYKRVTGRQDNPDWVRVKNLYRAYTLDFPQSSKIPEAYFEIAYAYFNMGYFREASNYYSLFLKDYPHHSLRNEALFMRARAYLKIGRYKKGWQDYEALKQSGVPRYKLLGEAGIGHIHFTQGQWHDALGIFKRILRIKPQFYIDDPEVLHDMGFAAIEVGDVHDGQEYLLHYINIVDRAALSPQVYFELAESFLADGRVEGARLFYERVIQITDPGKKIHILSQFRLAQYKAANLQKLSKRERQEIVRKRGDVPFQIVLDELYTDPRAQESRYDLFHRYCDRKSWELAYSMGKTFLRYDAPEKQKDEVAQKLGDLLVRKFIDLADKNQEIISLYTQEFPVISQYKQAKILILVGKAFEQDGLYDQASVVYYRALGLELSATEKKDLYFRRARVYLANNDLSSAQRLLKYLRRIYQGKSGIGEVNILSGKLREQQNRPKDALEFYKMAVEASSETENRAVAATNYLRLLFEVGDVSKARDLLVMFQKKDWLEPNKLQYWYGQLGQYQEQHGQARLAMQTYKRALADGMPEKSMEAQPIHLYLGDLLVASGLQEEALNYYRKAMAGKDDAIKQLAQAKMVQLRIDASMADVEPMLQ